MLPGRESSLLDAWCSVLGARTRPGRTRGARMRPCPTRSSGTRGSDASMSGRVLLGRVMLGSVMLGRVVLGRVIGRVVVGQVKQWCVRRKAMAAVQAINVLGPGRKWFGRSVTNGRGCTNAMARCRVFHFLVLRKPRVRPSKQCLVHRKPRCGC